MLGVGPLTWMESYRRVAYVVTMVCLFATLLIFVNRIFTGAPPGRWLSCFGAVFILVVFIEKSWRIMVLS